MPTDTLPRKIVDLNCMVIRQTFRWSTAALKAVAESTGRVVDQSSIAGRTVVGQTRSAADRSATTLQHHTREVIGQAEAQGAAVADVIGQEANRTVDRATDAVSDSPPRGTPYEEWTREELYERARELDIPGRASMNKAELIRALRR
jgi:hypothetical protein